jgi:hypothetical protein
MHDQVVGELIFDIKDGVALTLNRASDEAWPQDTCLIVGTAGTQYVTLLNTYESSRVSRSVPYSIKPQIFHADQLLIGHAFDRQDDVKFTSAGVSYYGLAEWVNRHGVTETSLSENSTHDSVMLRYDQPEAMSARFSEGIISIRFPWGLHNRLEELMLTHSPSVYLEYDNALGYGEILQHIKYMQDLITLCTDKAVTPKEVTFYNRDIPVRMLDGSTRGRQPIKYRASPITSPTFATKSKPQYPLDLDYDAAGGIETIATWTRIATDYAPVVNLMTSFRSEMKMYVENRFLNLAGAAEAFHRLKYPDATQIPATEWDHLQARMLYVVPDEHREWVSKKLAYLNDPILVKRLMELGAEAKQITGGLIGESNQKISRWAETIKDVRNELTHRKSGRDAFPGGVLHWLAESVYQVLRVCLLKECIAHNGVFDGQQAVSSPRVSELEAYVRTSLTEAREIVRRRQARNTQPP